MTQVTPTAHRANLQTARLKHDLSDMLSLLETHPDVFIALAHREEHRFESEAITMLGELHDLIAYFLPDHP